MSFSSDIKESLSKITNLKNKEEVRYEFIGYLISNNVKLENKKISYSTTSEYNINRFNKILLNMNIIDFKIDLKGRTYIITFPKIENLSEIKMEETIVLNDSISNNEELQKALVRGIFLGSGSINNPENKYHLEITFSSEISAKIIKKVLEEKNINMKTLQRKKGYSLYIKDGEEISKFLAFIEANTGVLKYEEIRVIREIKNDVNRKVNCETANLNKTVNAAVKQIEVIKRLQKEGKFESLSDNLKEIAMLRLENPDASLIELGQMLSKPIGKSGVNHRLNTLLELGDIK